MFQNYISKNTNGIAQREDCLHFTRLYRFVRELRPFKCSAHSLYTGVLCRISRVLYACQWAYHNHVVERPRVHVAKHWWGQGRVYARGCVAPGQTSRKLV